MVRRFMSAVCTLVSLLTRNINGFISTVSPTDRRCDTSTKYTITLLPISTQGYDEFNSSVRSIAVTFPPDYSITTPPASCNYTQKSVSGGCGLPSNNRVVVSLGNGGAEEKAQIVILEIMEIKNPSIETGAISYRVDLLDSSNGILGTSTFLANPNFIAPSFTSIQSSLSSDEVFAQATLKITFKPSSQIPANSILTLITPIYFPDFSINFFSSLPVCTLMPSIPLNCEISTIGGTSQITVKNAFPSSIPKETEISITFTNFITPSSTTEVGSFKVSLLNADTKRFNKEDNMKVKVSTGKEIKDVQLTMSNSTVGVYSLTILNLLKLPAPIGASSVIQITTSKFDTTRCRIDELVSGFSSPNCNSFIATNDISNNTQNGLVIAFNDLGNNVVNF